VDFSISDYAVTHHVTTPKALRRVGSPVQQLDIGDIAYPKHSQDLIVVKGIAIALMLTLLEVMVYLHHKPRELKPS
jgi:hypothetical protein